MLRRLVLIVALLGPATGLAQTAGQVLFTPTAFGPADCTSTTTSVALSWTSGATLATGDFYRIYVNNTSSCPTTGTPLGSQLGGGDITATSQTQTFPTSGTTLTSADFISKSGIGCSANATIYVCVQHWASGGTTTKATATGSAKLEVQPPPVPINVTANSGDSALLVSWDDGAANGVAAASYNVTAVAQGAPADTQKRNFTGKSNNRVDGLTNGVTYDVTVTSVSAGKLESAPSVVATGTPWKVNDFWDQYVAANGHEPGGCAGGPAGALSLLGVALAMRGLRRRS